MKPPTKSQRRYFGAATAAALAMLGWVGYRWTQSSLLFGCMTVLGILMSAVYYAFPSHQPWFIAGFRRVTYPIQWAMTLLVLATLYFCVVTPIALWYRWTGRSIVRSQHAKESNWESADSSELPESYFRTF